VYDYHIKVELASLQLSNFFFRCVELALGELRVLHLIKTSCAVGAVADMCGNVVRQRNSSHNCMGKTHMDRSA
jgi:hypothetical protein